MFRRVAGTAWGSARQGETRGDTPGAIYRTFLRSYVGSYTAAIEEELSTVRPSVPGNVTGEAYCLTHRR